MTRGQQFVLPLAPCAPSRLHEVVLSTTRTQRACHVRRLVIPSLCADCYELTSFIVDGRELLNAPIDAAIFGHASMAPGLGGIFLDRGATVIVAARAVRLPWTFIRNSGPIPLFWLTRRRMPWLRPLLRRYTATPPIPKFRAVVLVEDAGDT